MKCTACQNFGVFHRVAGKPCSAHANRVCRDCWKHHIYSQFINEEASRITCLQCGEALLDSQLKEGANHFYEYVVEVMKLAEFQKTAAGDNAKEPKEQQGAGAGGVDGAADDEGFVIVEEEDAFGGRGDDWEVINDDEM